MTAIRPLVATALIALLALAGLVEAQPQRRERPKKPSVVRLETVRAHAAELIDRAATWDPDDNDEAHADPAADARLLLARVARYADPKREADAYIAAAHAWRMTRLIAGADSALIERTLPVLMRNEELSRELAFTWWEGEDEPGAVLGVLGALVEAHDEKALVRAPRLVAALCVVHDDPRPFRANENAAPAERPERLFAYFTRSRMNGLTRNLSPELLTWVVDTVNADELAWANARYAGKANVGTLFHNIEYDLEHFQMGRPKKVTQRGFNLPNIAEHGGVCIDQAHFACHVGRAIGVPSAVCTGMGSSVGHAWVGYLRTRGGRAWWDFDEGRYEQYTKVRGSVTDPQRRQRVPDGEAAVRAAGYGLSAQDRHLAAALTDAAEVLGTFRAGWTDEVARFNDTPEREEQQREPTLEASLDLLERAATLNPGELRAWKQVQRAAASGAMSDAVKDRWADAAMRIAGNAFPEFAVDFAMPLVESVEDVDDRSAVLGRLFEYCRRAGRPGVAAELMIKNAELYEQTGDRERAYEAYAFTATEYADVSASAVHALAKATTMLQGHNHHALAVDLARKAWGKTTQPGFSPEFAGQSNWYRIGRIYASTLSAAGDRTRAESVTRQLSGIENAR